MEERNLMLPKSKVPKLSFKPSALGLSLCGALATLSLTACFSEGDSLSFNDPTTQSNTEQIALHQSLNYSNGTLLAQKEGDEYLVGAGIADITGAAAEIGMFGYASGQVVQGINDRLYSHAYIISGQTSNNNANRVVYVSTDLGAMFTSVKMAVIDRLQSKYGGLYTDDNVMLTATHTHVGNAGYSHQQLYQIASNDDTTAGYSTQNFNAIVDGIVASINQAHGSLSPGTITLAEGKLQGTTRNRSEFAYNQNKDAHEYDSNVNETMTQLRLNKADGTPIGLINWFAVHPTSFSNQFMHLSADNKGYAQQQAEKHLSLDTHRPIVAAFPNADSGDVVTAGGNANSAPGYEGSDNEWENVRRDGGLQYDKAAELWEQGEPVAGPVDVKARWIDLKNYQVAAAFTEGEGIKTLCMPARGYSFAFGAENGPSNIPGMYEGMTRESFRINDDINKVDTSFVGGLTRGVFSILSTTIQDDCQAEKQILLPTGSWGWINTRQPVQLMRIGNLAIVSVPGEPTTMVGRRLRKAVMMQLKDAGIDTVIVNGLANNYSGYFSTREEFSVQHYEGASTEYGPHQSNAYIQEYTLLAAAMRTGNDVSDLTTPPDNSNKNFSERTGVIFDDKPFAEQWGQTLQQPQRYYQKGETVSATFRGAHPKNNLRTEDTFLKVQRLQDGQWVDYLTDKDFDTSYTWTREGIAYSKVTIDWRTSNITPKGDYRIIHQGDWKNGWTQRITPYKGTSYSFSVR